jgi:hypothetical protein
MTRDEIERVIFESHSQDDREWAIDFAELRDQRTARFQQAREREDMALSRLGPAGPRRGFFFLPSWLQPKAVPDPTRRG